MDLSYRSYSAEAIDFLEDVFDSAQTDPMWTGEPVSFEVSDVTEAPPPFEGPVFTSVRHGFSRQTIEVHLSLRRDAVRAVVGESTGYQGYEIHRTGNRISIHAPHADARVRLLNFVALELWRRTVENLGGSIVHGSAVAREGEGWLIVGAKGAGKTTTALGLAVVNGYDLLENDRTALIPVGHAIMLMPVPNLVRVGYGTAEGLGRSAWIKRRDTRAERISGPVDGKMSVSRRHLRGEFGISLCAMAKLRGVVLPRIIRRSSATERHAVAPDRIFTVLRSQRRLPHDVRLPDDLLGLRRPTADESRAGGDALLARIAELPGVGIEYPGADRGDWTRLAKLLP